MSPSAMMPRTMRGRLLRGAAAAVGGGAAPCAGSVASLMLVSRGSGERCRIAWRAPPAPAERPKQRCRIGEALHVRLHLGQGGLLVLLFGGQYLQFRVLAGAILGERQLAVGRGRRQRLPVSGVALRVVLQRLQGIGHFDECGDDGAAVGRERLPVTFLRLVLPGGQGAAVEERRAG